MTKTFAIEDLQDVTHPVNLKEVLDMLMNEGKIIDYTFNWAEHEVTLELDDDIDYSDFLPRRSHGPN